MELGRSVPGEPLDETEVRALGVQVTFDPDAREAVASVSPVAWSTERVGWATSTLAPRLEVAGQRSIAAA